MADDYDFQINDLKFREATSDKMPYSRSTAPFRKDQFDSAPTVGDQSLTGWWTRGQLSFHKGASVKYYEVLEGESVLNRLQDCDQVDPWTPGQVSLAKGVDTQALPASVRADQQCAAAIDSSGFLWCTSSGTTPGLYRGNTRVSTGTLTVRGIACSDAGKVYACVGNKIEVTDAGSGSVTTTLLWTNSNSATAAENDFRSVFWAKNRLWALDQGGNWYCLPPTAGTIPSGGGAYLFWASGIKGDAIAGGAVQPWGFAASAGAVFLSIFSRIYAVTLDAASGSVPTVAAPVQVADLGSGDNIYSLAMCRSVLGVATGTSFRVAEASESGTLLMGPRLITYDFCEPVGIAVVGDRMYFAADFGIYEVNTADTTGDLSPTWATLRKGTFPSTAAMCVGRSGGSTPLFFAFGAGQTVAQEVYDDLTFRSAGYVLTGYHRFGTLDPKSFQSVSVRCGGTGGSVSVARVDADGTTTTVGTITPAESAKDFNLGLAVPVERIALKFTLTRDLADPGKGPELLGYQLKALPVPKRQRIFRWPLLIQDNIRLRRGNAVGKEGRAYSDIKALEALESSAAVVTFTDHRTGETGSAYIDSVEYQGVTASSPTSNGFGGLAYVTLRVIS